MFHRFQWTPVAARRNEVLAELEPVQPFFLMALADLAECKTFLDVGANVGAYSFFATELGRVERCIAFEANPSTASELRSNIALNDAPIEVIEAAVSSEPGEVTFGIVSEFAGDNAVVATALHGSFKECQVVRAIALDSLSDLPSPICLKIDVEGHEREVLSGARALMQKPCIVQVEDFSKEVKCILEPLGYFKLTEIGPDQFFTNIDALRGKVVGMYEVAMLAMLQSIREAANNPSDITLRRGDFSLIIGGKTYARLRQFKRLLASLVGGKSKTAESSSRPA